MLDESSAALLAAIIGACPGGGFVILEEEELRRAMPRGADVAKSLSCLEERRFIELRYAEDGTYCVRTMPAGRSYAERSEAENSERRRARRETFRYAFWGSFAGGSLGAVLLLLFEVLLRV